MARQRVLLSSSTLDLFAVIWQVSSSPAHQQLCNDRQNVFVSFAVFVLCNVHREKGGGEKTHTHVAFVCIRYFMTTKRNCWDWLLFCLCWAFFVLFSNSYITLKWHFPLWHSTIFRRDFMFEKTKDNATKKEMRPALIMMHYSEYTTAKGSQHNILVCRPMLVIFVRFLYSNWRVE